MTASVFRATREIVTTMRPGLRGRMWRAAARSVPNHSGRAASPQRPRSQRGALGQRAQLRPSDRGMDPSAHAAIGTGDDVLATDDPAGRKPDGSSVLPFVLMLRVGGLDAVPAGLHLEDQVEQARERQVRGSRSRRAPRPTCGSRCSNPLLSTHSCRTRQEGNANSTGSRYLPVRHPPQAHQGRPQASSRYRCSLAPGLPVTGLA